MIQIQGRAHEAINLLSSARCALCPFLVGNRLDSGAPSRLDLGDVISAALFPFGLTDPPCLASCDMNESGTLDLADAVCLAQYLFLAGPPPQPWSTGCEPAWQIGSPLSCEGLSDCSEE
jgi:hypothetical protein